MEKNDKKNAAAVVEEEKVGKLQEPLSEQFTKAAKAILEAEFLLIGAGAGCSADSGLATYKDIANVTAYNEKKLNYGRLCNPSWIEEDSEVFYGFWGQCFNNYKDYPVHNGYKIIKKWRDTLFAPKEYKLSEEDLRLELSLWRAHVYTSNVDNMFFKSGWSEKEVYAFHGSTLTWQCSVPCTVNRKDVWKLPENFRFKVDQSTMRAPANVSGEEKSSNHPKCIFCGAPARPNVLMFGDMNWLGTSGEGSLSYFTWKRSMKKVCNAIKGRLVILELGAGIIIPTVREESEHLLSTMSHATLIRINPDYPQTAHPAQTISFKMSALEAITKLDEEIEKLQKT